MKITDPEVYATAAEQALRSHRHHQSGERFAADNERRQHAGQGSTLALIVELAHEAVALPVLVNRTSDEVLGDDSCSIPSGS